MSARATPTYFHDSNPLCTEIAATATDVPAAPEPAQRSTLLARRRMELATFDEIPLPTIVTLR